MKIISKIENPNAKHILYKILYKKTYYTRITDDNYIRWYILDNRKYYIIRNYFEHEQIYQNMLRKQKLKNILDENY